ncbi:hypothetical protein DW322_11585 [Rhodococcus rhodnii]|uniref:Uncharacterized protein n=2 Tax=Rhodococcus rhodnii TaxID=38312 RepID=R7WLV1_9NOCA|nr:hypothetical protein Rrhod_2372 [Rhodococcus rhodnii LMG 5362]TXG90746.1 hypothetical protein DW322_11585 [Rhodococcus rhodnii]
MHILLDPAVVTLASEARQGSGAAAVTVVIVGFAASTLLAFQIAFRLDHRIICWWGRRRAAGEDEQIRRIDAKFHGKDVVVIDPRFYTISVACMNAIANSHGHYYIGERGNIVGSTQVAFQRLSGPPPLRIPAAPSRWRPLDA